MPSVAFSESSSVAGAPPHATSGILGADAGTNPRAIETGVVSSGLIEETARELMWRAAIAIPEDFRKSVVEMAEHETNPLSKYVLEQIGCNYRSRGRGQASHVRRHRTAALLRENGQRLSP